MPLPTSDNSSIPSTSPDNFIKTSDGCKSLQIRQNQLSQIFDSQCVSTLI
jgi:hypothetical protein